jgi:phosphatidylinositol alpha-1,6-mannosyltransferase
MAKPSLRVLALVTDAFGGHGGIAQYNRDLIRSLATCEGISDVVVLPRIAETSDVPAKVQQLRPQGGRFAYSLSALRVALGKNIDVVFCGHLLMAPLGAALAKLLGVPLWVQVHGIEAWHGPSRIHRCAIETASVVTSVSRYTRQRLLQWVRIDPASVKVLPNTVDPRFHPEPMLTRLSDQYDLSGKKVLLTVSRLASSERYKGHDRVIRALPRVLAQHPDAVYLVVGDGDDRSRLETIATKAGVSEQVHFTGLIEADDLPDHYRLADVFVMPSTGEGFGIAFLEAMASGVPVIGGNRDGSVDPLADGELGIAIDPDNEDQLVAAICTALRRSSDTTNRAARFAALNFQRHLEGLVSSHFRGAPPASTLRVGST